MKLKQVTAWLLAAALMITGIYFPVNPITANAAESATSEEVELTDSDAGVQVEEQEEAAAAGSIVYVRSARELVSALNGASVSGTSVTDTKTVKIQMEAPYGNKNDIGYKLTKGDVDLSKGIVLPENANITLDMKDYSISVSNNVVQSENSYLKLVVPKSSSLTIDSVEDTHIGIPFEIENKGTLIVGGRVNIEPSYGNGILNTGYATIEDFSSVNFQFWYETNSERAPIYNNGGTFIINTKEEIYTHDTKSMNVNTIINKNGNMTIESGYIGVGSTSGNTIQNDGKNAILEIRGGLKDYAVIKSWEGNAVMNNGGKVSILQGTKEKGELSPIPVKIEGEKVGILNYNGGSLDVYGGEISGGSGSNCAAISTTPWIDKDLTGTVSGGSVKLIEGAIESGNIGIAYAGDSLPVLLGGNIYGGTGAIVKYTAVNTPETDVTAYKFINRDGKETGAYKPAQNGNPAEALNEIINGLNPYTTQSLSNNAVTVSTYQELKDAVAKGGNIILNNSIGVSENLVFTKDTMIKGDGHNLALDGKGSQLTIASTAHVRFEGGGTLASFYQLDGTHPGILNEGTLSMNEVGIHDNTSASIQSELIRNSGTLTVEDSVIYLTHGGASVSSPSVALHNASGGKAYISGSSRVYNITMNKYYGTCILNDGDMWIRDHAEIVSRTLYGVALANTGTVEMSGDASAVSTENASVAVKNQGIFRMLDGNIYAACHTNASYHSYAILYDGNNLPQLVRGRVQGAHFYSDFTPNRETEGAAISCVTDWTKPEIASMGSFKDEKGLVIKGNNVSLIENAIPRMSSQIQATPPYVILEKGESLTDCVSSLFYIGYNYTISGNQILKSTSQNVVSVSKNGAGKWVAKAENVGMSMLRLELEEEGISDYVRVEVVEDREKLISDNYQGSVLDDTVFYNAYVSRMNIPLEWHLKDSYDVTAGDAEILDAQVSPKAIILESPDPDFANYFETEGQLLASSNTKMYEFCLIAKANASTEYNYLVTNEITGFSDIRAKLKVLINGKTEIIDIGSFDIKVDQKEPEFKFNQITLNSAYLDTAGYLDIQGTTIQPNKVFMKEYLDLNEEWKIVNLSLPNGFRSEDKGYDDAYAEYEELSYTGVPKQGSYSIPATLKITGYNGLFETKIPVKVINEKPKADVVSKKVTAAKTTADATDIPVVLTSKTEAGISTLKSVEILEKNSSFAIANSSLPVEKEPVADGKNYAIYENGAPAFYLQPRKALTKAEKVTLKFTYEGIRGTAKDSQIKDKSSQEPSSYFSTSVVNIVPVDTRKGKMTQTKEAVMVAKGKTRADGATAYDDVYLRFSTTPSNYEGGYFVVTGLNGKALTGITAGKVEKEGGAGYRVKIFANKDSKPGKQKLSIYWYDKDGKQIGKPLQAAVTLKAESELTLLNKSVVMDINKERTVDKKGNDITAQSMGVKMKFRATNDWYKVESLDPNFDITTLDSKTLMITPSETAMNRGTLLPLKRYFVDLKCYNSYGDNKIETIQVDIKDYDKVKAKVEDVVIYKDAPYTQSLLNITTSKPIYGIYVTKVEIKDDKTPFEVAAIKGVGYGSDYVYDASQAVWSISCKNNQYNSKLAGKNAVKLLITYQNGKTADATINVTIK